MRTGNEPPAVIVYFVDERVAEVAATAIAETEGDPPAERAQYVASQVLDAAGKDCQGADSRGAHCPCCYSDDAAGWL